MRDGASAVNRAAEQQAGQIARAPVAGETASKRIRALVRPAACLAFTTAVHLGVGAMLIYQWSIAFPQSTPEPPPVMDVDLAPLPPAPPEPEARPVPQKPDPQISDVDPAPAPPDPMIRPAVLLERLDAPVVLPAPVPFRHTMVRHEEAPLPLPSRERDGKPTFEGLLLARLEQFRRYPPDAQRRGEEGVVQLRFRMNREGRVLESAVVRGSGCVTLDREALATLRRAQPLPRIPDDRPEVLEVAVPIEFFLERGKDRYVEAEQTRRPAIPSPLK